jgi:S-adenosylmethionine synthetase
VARRSRPRARDVVLDLVVRARGSISPAAHAVEVVERKGLGHPDTICDAIAEHFCVRLCREYLRRFGTILHHNVDKVLLCGGAARAAFGGGEILAPIEIILAGRATEVHRGERIEVREIAVEACREWFRAHVPALDVDRHLRITSRVRPGSSDLVALFGRSGTAALANDTSCGAGFAPFTDLERVVLAVEGALNAPEAKRAHPEIGSDVKVMGVRRGTRIDLSIGCAFVGRHVRDAADYVRKKSLAHDLAVAASRSATQFDVTATLNAADDVDRGDVYVTVTGTSAEAGDDGEVGRGNRTSGLITPYRPMTLEAAAGKNPVTHVGKLYNLVASRIAEAITVELPVVRDASCVLVSRIGQPVTDPQVVDVCTALRDDVDPRTLEAPIGGIVRAELGRLDALRDALLAERVPLY